MLDRIIEAVFDFIDWVWEFIDKASDWLADLFEEHNE